MKKLIFTLSIFISFVLLADGTNRILYDGWVTGPGSEDNKYTYLLPFGYDGYAIRPDGAVVRKLYFDDHPLLYETDMGWPVPDEEENNLKYLFFGDTYFFTQDPSLSHNIMSKITD